MASAGDKQQSLMVLLSPRRMAYFVVFSTLDGLTTLEAIPEDVKMALPEVGKMGLFVPHFESKATVEVSFGSGTHIQDTVMS
jgi:hypothetical protein